VGRADVRRELREGRLNHLGSAGWTKIARRMTSSVSRERMRFATPWIRVDASAPRMWQPRIFAGVGIGEGLDEAIVVLDRGAERGVVVFVRRDDVWHAALARLALEEAHTANVRRADWRFAMADATLVDLLTDAYGFAVTNPPSTPTYLISTSGPNVSGNKPSDPVTKFSHP
jgi:hypothetical protein